VKLPAELKPESVVALVDTREQTPWDLSPLRSEPATLATGDYSVRGLESVVAIERKSLPDLLGCIGRERARFDREVDRLRGSPVRALIVEASWQDIERGEWRGNVTPQAALGSLLGWIAGGLPVVMAGDHQRAGVYASRLLYLAARREWRRLRTLASAVDVEPKPKRSRNAKPRETLAAFDTS
jgi:DNA excision repair protein ERCC-4